MKKSIALFIIIICLITTGCGTSKFGAAITDTQPLNDPQITYGEFPFEITYMLNNETITVKDVYVCEYVGAFWNWNRGHYREWNGYIKSTNESSVLITEDVNKKIYCSVGDPGFYMGECDIDKDSNSPIIYSKEPNDAGGWTTHIFNQADQDKYGIEIISYKFSVPIENMFK